MHNDNLEAATQKTSNRKNKESCKNAQIVALVDLANYQKGEIKLKMRSLNMVLVKR